MNFCRYHEKKQLVVLFLIKNSIFRIKRYTINNNAMELSWNKSKQCKCNINFGSYIYVSHASLLRNKLAPATKTQSHKGSQRNISKIPIYWKSNHLQQNRLSVTLWFCDSRKIGMFHLWQNNKPFSTLLLFFYFFGPSADG